MEKHCCSMKSTPGALNAMVSLPVCPPDESGGRGTETGESALLEKPTIVGIRRRGVLKVGTTGDFPPMSYPDPVSGGYAGFDAALAADLAGALGVRAAFVSTSWPSLMDDVLSGKLDLALSGITITEERKKQALMSGGYLENGKTILCRAEDADAFTSLGAVNRPGVRVMVNPGGLNERFARSALPHAVLMIHPANREIPFLIASGAADVMITETVEAAYYTRRDSRLAAPLMNEPFTRAAFGILMPKGAEDLMDFVNAFLDEEKASGRLDALKANLFPR